MKNTLQALLLAMIASLCFAGAARAQTVGGGSMTTFPGAPTGGCLDPQQAKDNSNGNTYSCLGGAWVKIGPAISIGTTSVAGCGVEWTGNYNFTVGACMYSINGINYNSPLTNLTLTTPDPTLDRIDVVYVDNTGTAAALAGTPAATPLAPTVDPTTELQLTFIYVTANTIAPVNVVRTDIYHTGLEWTATKSGIPINLTSTNNPYDDTKDVEATAAVINNWAQFAVPAAGTIDLATRNALVFYLRSKAAWSPTRSLTIQWMNGATAKGTPIIVKDGQFGFNSATLGSYQQISIPASSFGINGIPVTQVRFTVSGPAGVATIGFYLDDITLQGGIAPSTLPTGVMIYRGAYSTSTAYNPNDVVTSGGKEYIALLGNTNVALATASTWQLMTSAVAGDVTTTGSPATGNLAKFSGAASITNGDMSGDCATSGTLALICTKTNNVAFAASATTDTTNASNISSGTLPAARLPNPSASTLGGVQSFAAVSNNFLTSISTSGVPAAARPTCANLSDSATSCATDATNASNISSGTLATARNSATIRARGIFFEMGDPGGSVLTVASTTTAYVTVPFACTISAYNLTILPSGTITVKFWKKATGTAAPTSSDSISTSGVGISTGNNIHNATVSDFTTTTVTKDDVMAMNVTAVGTASYVIGTLQCDQ